MKRYINIISLLVLGLFLTNVSVAGDVEDVKKATIKHFVTQNAGDAKAHINHHTPYHTTFGPGGGLLNVSHPREEQVKSLQAALDAGTRFDLELVHLDVNVYGNAAVVTGYLAGTVTNPDGTTQQMMARRTAVLIKEGNEWKEVHIHISPVMAAGSR